MVGFSGAAFAEEFIGRDINDRLGVAVVGVAEGDDAAGFGVSVGETNLLRCRYLRKIEHLMDPVACLILSAHIQLYLDEDNVYSYLTLTFAKWQLDLLGYCYVQHERHY